jgi:YHS domain-containing protein
MGQKFKSDPALFTVHDGRTYLFSNAEAKMAFDGMPDGVSEKADERWAALTKPRTRYLAGSGIALRSCAARVVASKWRVAGSSRS